MTTKDSYCQYMYELGVKGQGQTFKVQVTHLKICLMNRKQTPLTLIDWRCLYLTQLPMVCRWQRRFWKPIWPCSQRSMSTQNMYLKSALLLILQTHLKFLMECFHSCQNDCLWYVDNKEWFRMLIYMYLGVKGQGQYELKIFFMARYNSSYIFWWWMFIFGTMVAYNKSFGMPVSVWPWN